MFDIVKNKTNEIVKEAKILGYSEVYTLDDFNFVSGGYKNRYAVENKHVEILLNPHTGIRKDNLHYRKTGLNHVMCKLAAKNKTAVAFSFDALRSDFGKLISAVKLCRKYNVKILFPSLAESRYKLRSAHDILSIVKVLGGDKKMLLTKKNKNK